jgi:hypothetical protein
VSQPVPPAGQELTARSKQIFFGELIFSFLVKEIDIHEEFLHNNTKIQRDRKIHSCQLQSGNPITNHHANSKSNLPRGASMSPKEIGEQPSTRSINSGKSNLEEHTSSRKEFSQEELEKIAHRVNLGLNRKSICITNQGTWEK